MADERDELPILLVTDSDNFLIAVGDPEYFKATEIKKYMKQGYNINTMKFKEYAAKEWKWIWDKNKGEENAQMLNSDPNVQESDTTKAP
jgi:hypothetical protein